MTNDSERSEYQNFVLLASQRSGSTWVIDRLNGLPETRAYGELFLGREGGWDVGAGDVPRFVASAEARERRRPGAVFGYLDALYAAPAHVGFKLMYTQVRAFPEVAWYLRRHAVPVIHLIRRNLLDVVISASMKSATGRPHLMRAHEVIRTAEGHAEVRPRAEETPPTVRLELDPATLVPRLTRLARKAHLATRWLRLTRQPHIEITYEALMQHPDHFGVLPTYLGIPFTHLPGSDLVRIRKGTHAEVLANYDAVKAVLAGTDFEGMIR